MKYLFIFGRDPVISKLELETYLKNKNISYESILFSKNIYVLEIKSLNPKIIEGLGGTVKIAQVISESSKLDEIEYDLERAELYLGTKNKLNYYITAYNERTQSFLEDYLKAYFKKQRLKAVYKKPKHETIEAEPSQLIKKNIIEEGLEIITFKNYIAKTISVYNPFDLKKRDLGRPEKDFLKSISIRLAKILINISGIKENEVLLDPFCGVGTILQEALLKQINVIGSDSDKISIEQSEKNLKWLKINYKVNANFKLINTDCRLLSKYVQRNSINAVVTEPYLGPYRLKLPSIREASNTVQELTVIYDNLFSQLGMLLKKDAPIVIITPIFKTYENKIIPLNINNIVDKYGFEILEKFDYMPPNSKILRVINVIKRKSF